MDGSAGGVPHNTKIHGFKGKEHRGQGTSSFLDGSEPVLSFPCQLLLTSTKVIHICYLGGVELTKQKLLMLVNPRWVSNEA